MRVGLIGLGAIGQGVLRLLRARPIEGLTVVGVLVRDVDRPRPSGTPKLVASAADLLVEQPDVVVEAGGHAALREHGPAILRAGCDLVVVSVGALAQPDVQEALLAAAKEGNARIRVASGAIGALDAISSAAIGGLDSVTHTTRKPPRALLPPEEAGRLRAPRELFSGPAREAVLRFPESVNVAAAVSLAGIGFDRTTVRVIADPGVDRNQHEVEFVGTFGSARFEIRSIPSDENPKTGRIVAMSIVNVLRQRAARLAFS